jgi:hypothetical protein
VSAPPVTGYAKIVNTRRFYSLLVIVCLSEHRYYNPNATRFAMTMRLGLMNIDEALRKSLDSKTRPE